MTRINNGARRGSFRKWVRQLFSSLIKREDRHYLEEIFQKLQDIEDEIEIIAREIARQIKQGE